MVTYTYKVDSPINYLEANEMSIERKNEIEALAREYGLSFASAKRMLEEIEVEYDANESMAEMWY